MPAASGDRVPFVVEPHGPEAERGEGEGLTETRRRAKNGDPDGHTLRRACQFTLGMRLDHIAVVLSFPSVLPDRGEARRWFGIELAMVAKVARVSKWHGRQWCQSGNGKAAKAAKAGTAMAAKDGKMAKATEQQLSCSSNRMHRRPATSLYRYGGRKR